MRDVVEGQDHVSESSAEETCEDNEGVKGELSTVSQYMDSQKIRRGTYDRDNLGLNCFIDWDEAEV